MPRIQRVSLIEAANAPSVWTPNDGLTQSLIGACTCCPLRGRLMARLWRHPKKDSMTNFGSFTHEALDALYNKECWKTRLRKEFKIVLSEGKVDRDKAEAELNLCLAVVEVYEEYYAADLELKWEAIENEFEVTVRGRKRRGKIDGVFNRFKMNKFKKVPRAWLMEHKTKSRFNELTLLNKVAFDFQNLYYAESYNAVSQVVVDGIIYNVIRKPQLRVRAGETYGSYLDRVKKDVRARKEWYFTRWEITFTPNQIERWQSEVDRKMDWVSEMLTGDIWWRNEHACDQPFECEYLPACSSNSMTGYYQINKLFPELKKKRRTYASKEESSPKGCRRRSG